MTQNGEPEINLDLSRLLGFQGLHEADGETDLAKALAETHNKIGEVPPNGVIEGQT